MLFGILVGLVIGYFLKPQIQSGIRYIVRQIRNDDDDDD